MGGFFDVDVLGLRVRIALADQLSVQQRDRARAAWSGALSEGEQDAELTVPLRADGDFDRAMEELTVEVTLAALEALRGRRLMFHAAGVADADGRVAAFVGPSGRGKTTLSRELGRHHAYVSDETVAVDRMLAVRPYRKPLSVVRHGAPKAQVSPDEAALQPLPDAALRLAALVLIDRDPELEAPEVVPVPLTEALPELVTQMSYLRDQDRPLQAIAAVCDAVGGVRRLRYRDASTAVAALPDVFDGVGSNSVWAPAPDAAATGPFHADEVVDALVVEHQVLVMTSSTVHVLDGIAPTIWLTAAAGADVDRIVRTVEAEFGSPPEGDSRELVVAALDELLAAGVLGRRASRL